MDGCVWGLVDRNLELFEQSVKSKARREATDVHAAVVAKGMQGTKPDARRGWPATGRRRLDLSGDADEQGHPVSCCAE